MLYMFTYIWLLECAPKTPWCDWKSGSHPVSTGLLPVVWEACKCCNCNWRPVEACVTETDGPVALVAVWSGPQLYSGLSDQTWKHYMAEVEKLQQQDITLKTYATLKERMECNLKSFESRFSKVCANDTKADSPANSHWCGFTQW